MAFQRDARGRLLLIADLGRPLLKTGERTDIALAIDAGISHTLRGNAVNSSSLSIAIGGNAEIATAIARGTILTLRSAGVSMAFDLDGAGAALAGLAHCATSPLSIPQDGLALGIIASVASGPVQVGGGPVESDEIAFAWAADPVAASAREVPIEGGRAFLDLVLSRLDRVKNRCDGHLSPQVEAPIEAQDLISESAIVACRMANGEDRFAALFFFARGGRFVEFDLEAEGHHRDDAVALRNRIAAVADRPPLPEREFHKNTK